MAFTMSKITDYLFIGNEIDCFSKDNLNKNGVTHIINTTVDIPNHFTDDFKYLRISVKDNFTENIYDHFMEVITFIKKAINEKGIVMIHCHGGISRSVSFAIAFIMNENKVSYNDAFDMVVKGRPIAKPNVNFIGQLFRFQKNLGIENNVTIQKFHTFSPVKSRGVVRHRRRINTN